MFARVKRTDGRAYLVVVENSRPREDLPFAYGPRSHRQRVVARLGRVDHLSEKQQADLAARLTRLLAGVRPAKAARGAQERRGTTAAGSRV